MCGVLRERHDQVLLHLGAIAAAVGPEFLSKAPDRWVSENGVTLNLSRPAKPMDYAFVEPFNGQLRDE